MSAPQNMESSRTEETAGTESPGSSAPLLSESTQIMSTIPGAFPDDTPESADNSDSGGKLRKRDFWKMGKKPEDDKAKGKGKTLASSRPSAAYIAPIFAGRPVSPMRSSDGARPSASPHRHPYGAPSSPGGANLFSSSPRLHSPASSQIFERNVQEDVAPPQASPQIPSHILTENHIPPALDATSVAITDSHLDPDSVEIVTHATHQSAAATIGSSHMPADSLASSFHDIGGIDQSLAQSVSSLSHAHRSDADNVSNYGNLDSTTADVRRLSFISFADVVHAEQTEHASEGMEGLAGKRHSAQLPLGALSSMPRSPSPLSSPGHGGLGTSPPSSVSPSFKGTETSPNRGSVRVGSPLSSTHGSPLGGDLNIETMRQALRKTGSGDLSGARSPITMTAFGEEK